MCIMYRFHHAECGHNSDEFLSRCSESEEPGIACPLTPEETVIIKWFYSCCDACFAPQDNKLPEFTAVDLDREELRAPAKLFLASFLDHASRHGPESQFALNRQTMSYLPRQYIEDAQTICSALENKIRWDSQKKGRDNHTLAEKQLILDLRVAIQTTVTAVFDYLPAHTTSTPYNIFYNLTPGHRNMYLAQHLRELCQHAGYDEWGRELVSPLCNCPELTRDDLGRLQIVHEPSAARFSATCGRCNSKMIFLQREDEITPPEQEEKPWWLLVLQGVSKIGAVNASGLPQPANLIRRSTNKVQRSASKVARAASTRIGRASGSLLRTLTGKTIKEKK